MLVYNLSVIENSLLMYKIWLFVKPLADVRKDVQLRCTLDHVEGFLIRISFCPFILLPLTDRILKQIVTIYIVLFNFIFSSSNMNVNIHKKSPGVFI